MLLPCTWAVVGVSMLSISSCPAPGWPRPISIVDEEEAPPELDTAKVLPPQLQWLGEYIHGVADSIQAPVGLIGPMALACASAAACRGFEFQGRSGHTEVAALWVAGGAAPGERKSSITRHISRPFRKRLIETRNDISNELPGWMQRIDDFGLGKDADFLKQKPSVTSGGTQKRQPAFTTEESREEESILITDTSTAGITETLNANSGRAFIFSDEASFIDRAAGRRSEGLDTFLKGWSGDNITIRRARTTISIPRPQITIGLLVQEDALRQLFVNKTLIQRGFTQRFLLSVPKPLPHRSYGMSVEVPQHLEFAWINAIHNIDDVSRETADMPRVIRLGDAGMKSYALHADNLDELRRRNECYPTLAEWLSKAHGQLLRIAGLLTLLDNANATEIQPSAVAAAAQWVEYFREHFRHFLVSARRLSPVQEQAQRVLQWLKAQYLEVASRSQVSQNLRCKGFETAESWLPVFQLLVERGWIRLRPCVEMGDKGGRPSIQYEVNPSLHTDATET